MLQNKLCNLTLVCFEFWMYPIHDQSDICMLYVTFKNFIIDAYLTPFLLWCKTWNNYFINIGKTKLKIYGHVIYIMIGYF